MEGFNFVILFSRFSCILPMAMEYVKANLRIKILQSVKPLQNFKITTHMLRIRNTVCRSGGFCH